MPITIGKLVYKTASVTFVSHGTRSVHFRCVLLNNTTSTYTGGNVNGEHFVSIKTIDSLSHLAVQNGVELWYLYCHCNLVHHYSDVIMIAMASQITSLTIIYSTVYSGADRKNQSSTSLAFVTGEFPALMASNSQNVSIWWRHYAQPVQPVGGIFTYINAALTITLRPVLQKRYTFPAVILDMIHFNSVLWRWPSTQSWSHRRRGSSL